MATLEDIRDEIVVEVGEDSSDDTALAAIFSCIKGALRILSLKARARFLVTTSYVTLQAGDSEVTLPDNFDREQYVYRKSASGGKIDIPVDKEGGIDFNSSQYGTLTKCRVIGKRLIFNNAAAEDTVIYVDHFKNDVSTAALSDTFIGQEKEIECVKHLAKATFYRDYEEESQKANEHVGLAADLLGEVDGDYQEHELPGHVVES